MTGARSVAGPVLLLLLALYPVVAAPAAGEPAPGPALRALLLERAGLTYMSWSECGLALATNLGEEWLVLLVDPASGEPLWSLTVSGRVSGLASLGDQVLVVYSTGEGSLYIVRVGCDGGIMGAFSMDPAIAGMDGGSPGVLSAWFAEEGGNLVAAVSSTQSRRVAVAALDLDGARVLWASALRLQVPIELSGAYEVWAAAGGGRLAVVAEYAVEDSEDRVTGIALIDTAGSQPSISKAYMVEKLKFSKAALQGDSLYVSGRIGGNLLLLWFSPESLGTLSLGPGEAACLEPLEGGSLLMGLLPSGLAEIRVPGEASFYRVEGFINGSRAVLYQCTLAGDSVAMLILKPAGRAIGLLGSGVLVLAPLGFTGETASRDGFANMTIKRVKAAREPESLGTGLIKELGTRGLIKAVLEPHNVTLEALEGDPPGVSPGSPVEISPITLETVEKPAEEAGKTATRAQTETGPRQEEEAEEAGEEPRREPSFLLTPRFPMVMLAATLLLIVGHYLARRMGR